MGCDGTGMVIRDNSGSWGVAAETRCDLDPQDPDYLQKIFDSFQGLRDLVCLVGLVKESWHGGLVAGDGDGEDDDVTDLGLQHAILQNESMEEVEVGKNIRFQLDLSYSGPHSVVQDPLRPYHITH